LTFLKILSACPLDLCQKAEVVRELELLEPTPFHLRRDQAFFFFFPSSFFPFDLWRFASKNSAELALLARNILSSDPRGRRLAGPPPILASSWFLTIFLDTPHNSADN